MLSNKIKWCLFLCSLFQIQRKKDVNKEQLSKRCNNNKAIVYASSEVNRNQDAEFWSQNSQGNWYSEHFEKKQDKALCPLLEAP